jgi:phage recombination protein Bet
MTTSTATPSTNGLVPYTSTMTPAAPELTFNERQVTLIRTQIAPGCSEDELALFLEVCRATGLNPLMRQIYAIKRKSGDESRMTIQTGIDGYRLLAARTGLLAGIDDAIYDTEEGKHPGRASVTVYRLVAGQRVAFAATARWSEYAAVGKEHQQPIAMWAKMPWLMLGKCAEALALRRAFPAELSGVYTGEEMAQADNPPLPYVEQASQASDDAQATAPAPADRPADRAAVAMRSKEIMDLLVQRQCFNDKDRRLELDSVFAAIEAAGATVNAKSVKAELQQRLADAIELSGLDMGMPGN